MKWLKRRLKELRCTHPEQTLVKTDLVLSQHVCEGCGKSIVEPYNPIKVLSQHERAIRNRSHSSH